MPNQNAQVDADEGPRQRHLVLATAKSKQDDSWILLYSQAMLVSCTQALEASALRIIIQDASLHQVDRTGEAHRLTPRLWYSLVHDMHIQLEMLVSDVGWLPRARHVRICAVQRTMSARFDLIR